MLFRPGSLFRRGQFPNQFIFGTDHSSETAPRIFDFFIRKVPRLSEIIAATAQPKLFVRQQHSVAATMFSSSVPPTFSFVMESLSASGCLFFHNFNPHNSFQSARNCFKFSIDSTPGRSRK